MVAQQVLAKTLRDTLFLAHHPPSSLPLAFALSAVLSVAMAALLGRALERWGPRRVLSAAWIVYAATLTAGLLGATSSPGAAFGLYLLVSAGGVALASGFWLQVGEAFDPRSARHGIAGIGSAGALGGLAAGAAAWLLRGTGGDGVLGILTMVLLATGAAASLGLTPLASPVPRSRPEPLPGSALGRIFRSDLLRNTALLLTAVSAAATLLDWRFKADVAAHFGGAERVGVFAAFYGITSALMFALQSLAAGPLLARAGIGRTLATLPGGLMLAALGALAAPGALATTLARGTEAVLRGSLFRSGYELLFSPLDPAERRATKGLLDVGFDRLGDVVGAAIAAGVLALGLAVDPAAMLSAAALGTLGLALALGIERAYRAALAQGLRRGVVADDPSRSIDRATLATLAFSGSDLGIDVESWRNSLIAAAAPAVEAGGAGRDAGERAEPPAPAGRADASDLEETRAALLQSGDPMRIRFALASNVPMSAALVELAIPLLARDDVARPAQRALRAAAPHATARLARALLDPATPDPVRRRLPRVIAGGEPRAAAAALTGALEDERFEIRLAAGRALLTLHTSHPEVPLETPLLIASVLAEAARGRKVWNAARDLEPGAGDSDETPFGDLVRDRTTRGLEHCFTLLALLLPGEPLRMAWRALHTGDPVLRGTALEYLDGALPPLVREALWPHLEVERAAPRPHRPAGQVMDDLLRASESVEFQITAIRSGNAPPRPAREPEPADE